MTTPTRCICCANGNDLAEGDVCEACDRTGVVLHSPPLSPPPKGTLARAVWDARGGPAPISKRGFA
jgi:hypothetical protein